MDALQWWELLSYVVTVIGLPLAIFTFWQEKRKERENEDEETYQLLSDAYTDFLSWSSTTPTCSFDRARQRRNCQKSSRNGGRSCSKCWCRSSSAPTCSPTMTT